VPNSALLTDTYESPLRAPHGAANANVRPQVVRGADRARFL